MATRPLHLPPAEVTVAALLLGMLKTCRTKADLHVWRDDYRAHVHLLDADERLHLMGKGAARMFHILGGQS